MNNNLKLIISIGILVIGVVYRSELKVLYDKWCNNDSEAFLQEGIFSVEKLAQYDGVKVDKLYLSVLGIVFDVTKGRKHYEKGAGYHYFIGKDGSRALVTGNFKDESRDKDHVMDLSCSELFTLVHWRNTFKQRYKEMGVLVGRFYNLDGKPTAYSIEFNNKIKQCEREKEMSRKEDHKYPPCNMAWSAEEGTKVWCTKSSGGITRSWIGVPKQLYTPGVENPRCVCVNDEATSSGLFKEYTNCPNKSVCFINPEDK